jgi:hypothetical protein
MEFEDFDIFNIFLDIFRALFGIDFVIYQAKALAKAHTRRTFRVIFLFSSAYNQGCYSLAYNAIFFYGDQRYLSS